jgi:hypothetical protein
MSLSTEDLMALAWQLPTLSNNTPDASAASVKIPPFGTLWSEVWFVQLEVQFSSQRIVSQDTRYNYVVSALDKAVAEEILAFICVPPVLMIIALRQFLRVCLLVTITD